MYPIQQSDVMLCNNSAFLHYKDAKVNDGLFMQQMSVTRPTCIRSLDLENKMFVTPSSRFSVCNPYLSKRGGNMCNQEPNKPCPTFDNYNLSEFLLVPCMKPTYKNYPVINEKGELCSKRHQVLNNWTKRKDFTTPFS
jgi:hypothetical protein